MQIRHIFTGSCVALAIALLPAIASAQLVTVSNDAFDDGDATTNSTGLGGTTYSLFVDGDGTFDESTSGQSVQTAGTGNWGRVEYQDNTEYSAPQFSSTVDQVQYSWTVGNIAITNDQTGASPNDNRDYRVQFNVNDSDQAQGTGSERWVNGNDVANGIPLGPGAISLDLFFDASGAGAGVAGFEAQIFEKDSSQAVLTDGTNVNTAVAPGDTGWDFANTQETFTVTLDDTGYTWSSTYAGFTSFTRTWADSNFVNNEFEDGIWGGVSIQNNNNGRGTATLTNISVGVAEAAVIPEPSSAMLLCGTLGMYVLRRRRS